MKKEIYAATLIAFAFFTGMVITATTSGCDHRSMERLPLVTDASNR